MPFRLQLPSLPKCTEDALRVQVWGFEKQESAQAVWSNPSPSRVRQQQCDVTAEIACICMSKRIPALKSHKHNSEYSAIRRPTGPVHETLH